MRRAAGRPRDADIDRRILEATRTLVASEGYGGLSLEEIARKAGVGKQSLYRRWARKPLLVFDAVLGGGEAVEPLLPDTGSLTHDLRAVTSVQTSVYQQAGTLQLVRGLVADCLAEPWLLDELRTRFLRPRLSVLAGVVDRARARGEVAGGIDADVVAEAIAGTMLFHFLLYVPDDEGDARFGEQVASLVALGAMPREESGSEPPASAR